MDVYLVRHAIAHERNAARWPDDSLRPLTAEGKRKFRKAAARPRACLPKSARVLTSPFVRARETADDPVHVAKLRKPIEAPELAPGAPTEKAFALLRARGRNAIVLVGHEPSLSVWLSVALGGRTARARDRIQEGWRSLRALRTYHRGRARHAGLDAAAARVAPGIR